jgi:hypothetical protein
MSEMSYRELSLTLCSRNGPWADITRHGTRLQLAELDRVPRAEAAAAPEGGFDRRQQAAEGAGA